MLVVAAVSFDVSSVGFLFVSRVSKTNCLFVFFFLLFVSSNPLSL